MKVDTLLTEADEGDFNSRCGKELTKEYQDNAQPNSHLKDKNHGGELVCYKCLRGGTLVCCCAKGCRRRYHPSCLDPPLNHAPSGFWHCVWCAKKKLDLGVHSISEGVEAILDSRELVSQNKVMEREYFVKYQGLSHAHNRWILESQMLLKVPKLLAKFKRKHQVIRWKREWSIPHRLVLKRAIVLQKQNDEHFDGHDYNDSIGRYEWLVKWTGLGYDHVTWELDDASFMTSSEGLKLIKDYERRRERTDRLSKSFEDGKEGKASFAELSVLPAGDSPGFHNQHLGDVNKLRLCWHEGRNALILDDKIGQERVMKVILFILCLYCKVRRPFLIISTSTALSVWEREFLHLAPSANLVVYNGNKNVRSSIRALEFYNDDGGVLFQILLSSSDIISEDLDELSCIPWEAIIIDECQHHRILEHLDNIEILTAETKLLLVRGQIKEDRADYIKLLSFLKSGHHRSIIPQTEAYFSDSISNLKSQLEQYVAFKCNTWSNRFAEYWVPAQLSSLQLEQYCSMLLSNSMLLCSAQKSNSVDVLHDLITSTRMCCNHPYLLDQSLHNSVCKGIPVEEYLNIGIKASGKLQLLEKILLESRSRGLRVMILYQCSGGLKTIGDILDDVLCQRFGKDCYVRYAKGYIPSEKQAALDTFNDRESGKFVFLMESRACHPSVKLSSVDTIILFDSDWDPQNNLRALQKMSISSQFEQLTVFRLYSSFTVEEKVLMLAREGITLDSDIQLISQSTCHSLLRWGASYLFKKLDDLHGSGTRVFASYISSDQSLLSHVICELSTQLGCNSGDTDHHGWSFIVRVQLKGGEYARNILLLGEREMKELDNGLDDFSWSTLLKGRNPQWKFLSVSTQRIRKAVNHSDPIRESECENDVIIRKKRKVLEDNIDPKGRKVSKDNVDPKRRKVSKYNVDVKRTNISKDIVDSLKNGLKNKKQPSSVYKTGNRTGKFTRATAMKVKSSKQKNLNGMPKSTELLSKPDLAGLFNVLKLPKNVKAVAMMILEHIFECYNVNCQDVSTMQAFEISVCWLAASILKHKIDKKSSFALAKVYLHFGCEEEEVTYVYSTLQKFKNSFSTRLEHGHSAEECTSDHEASKLSDLEEEEMQKGFRGSRVSDLVDSGTRGHDHQRESPTTVLSTHDQTYTEKFRIRPMADENCPSENTSGSFPVEADAIPIESYAEDDGMNEMDTISEKTQILVNEIVSGDSCINMSTHPVQLNSVETNTVSCNTAPVPEVSQYFRVRSPVCGESTTLDFAETTLPFMQPSNANLRLLAQVPSLLENGSVGEFLPIEEYFSHLCTLQDAELIFQASKDPVEPDPLQIEIERITKETEEASKIHQQKILQLKSDYQKQVEELRAKYLMLLKKADTAVALQKRELETCCEMVHKNMLLAESSFKHHVNCEELAIQRTEQEMSKLTCLLCYGGVLQHAPSMSYVGGVCEELGEFEVDRLSVTHLCSRVMSSGYSEPERFLYKFKDDKAENVRELYIDNDEDVLNIIQALQSKRKSVLEIYALHSVNEGFSNHVVEGGDDEVGNSVIDVGVVGVGNPIIDGGVEGVSNNMVDEEDDALKTVNEAAGDVNIDNAGNEKRKGKRKGKESTKGKEKMIDDDDDVDDRLEGCDFEDSENEELDLFFEDNGRSFFEEMGMIRIPTSEIGSNSEADEGGGKHGKKYPEFNQFVDMKRKIDLKLGMKFANYIVFREALRRYCIGHGIDCVFMKNEYRRVTVHCKGKCGWRMHASISRPENCFKIKTWSNSEHKDCGWSNHNSKENAREHKMLVSRFQYEMLWNYCAAVRLYNPGSTMKLQLENHKFERLYACLDATKRGLKFCRPIIYLDGCSLNAGFGGQLLVAVARDGNDNIFPVACAAVETETIDSWQWFIDLLLDDIRSNTECRWIFMFDKLKGLKDVLESSGVEYRFCVRHLYASFKLTYKGQTLKDLLWNAARAATAGEFGFQIEQIRKIDEGAARWLEEMDPTTWSRHKFSPHAKCGALQNNIAKSFIAAILFVRDKPIITMMETIRRMLMKRFAAKKDGMMKYNGVICPRIQAKLEKAKEDAVLCTPHVNGARKFEVDTSSGSKRVVDLVAGTCSCRIWDLTGIPCAHAISAIYEQKEVPENYVSHYYTKETFMSTYGEVMINPMPSADEWPQIDNDPIEPPPARVQVGTPKKARKRARTILISLAQQLSPPSPGCRHKS